MKLGDLYIHKTNGNIIQIDSFAGHLTSGIKFKDSNIIIVYTNLEKCMDSYGSSPCFNGYGTEGEIESEYDLAIPCDELRKFETWESVVDYLKEKFDKVCI